MEQVYAVGNAINCDNTAARRLSTFRCVVYGHRESGVTRAPLPGKIQRHRNLECPQTATKRKTKTEH